MTTTNGIWISGFKFEWIEFEDLHGLSESRNDLSRFECVVDRFGVYIFVYKTCVLYVGRSGEKVGQGWDLKNRIGQYFKNKKDPGVTFPDNWMKKEGCSYESFKKFIAECNLVTLSVEENNEYRRKILFGNAGIIGAMEKFWICELSPLYNALGYRMTNDEENRMRKSVTAKLQT